MRRYAITLASGTEPWVERYRSPSAVSAARSAERRHANTETVIVTIERDWVDPARARLVWERTSTGVRRVL
jgi:ribosomal protein L31E